MNEDNKNKKKVPVRIEWGLFDKPEILYFEDEDEFHDFMVGLEIEGAKLYSVDVLDEDVDWDTRNYNVYSREAMEDRVAEDRFEEQWERFGSQLDF